MAIDWTIIPNQWEIHTPRGYRLKEGVNNTIYDWTGFDPLGLNEPDWYGKDIQRGVATELSPARSKQYEAARNEIGDKYAQARTRALQNMQARGLQTSGMAQKQTSDLYSDQMKQETQVFADLMAEEQNFLDQVYMKDKDIAVKIAQMEKMEAMARQQMTMDFISEAVNWMFELYQFSTGFGGSISPGELASVGTQAVPGIGG